MASKSRNTGRNAGNNRATPGRKPRRARVRLAVREADLLKRVRALGKPESQVEREAGIPAAFLAKAKAGLRSGDGAAPSWAKLARYLAAEEAPAAAPTVPEAIPGACPTCGRGGEVPAELRRLLSEASTLEEIDEALRLLAASLLSGDVDRPSSREHRELLKERRQVLTKIAATAQPNVIASAIDILTPEERELVDAYRARIAAPPLKPGQTVAPPPLPPEAIVAPLPSDAHPATPESAEERAP